MELICPSCEARYQVPDSAISANGRRVSCSDCGHDWQAFPPAIVSSTAAAPPSTTEPRATESARHQQFAEIRGMLDEVQGGEDSGPAGREPRNTETLHSHATMREDEAMPGRGSAFLSGFLLVVTIGAVLIAIFLLRPQIVALIPALEPIMTGYVEAVNAANVTLAGWLDVASVTLAAWLDTAQIMLAGWLDAAQIILAGWLDMAEAWLAALTGDAAQEPV